MMICCIIEWIYSIQRYSTRRVILYVCSIYYHLLTFYIVFKLACFEIQYQQVNVTPGIVSDHWMIKDHRSRETFLDSVQVQSSSKDINLFGISAF